MKDIHNQSYYELLEIDPSANQEEILKAYNRARATYGHNSPALYSLFNREEAEALLKLIDEAYSILSNQFKRREYDVLGGHAKPVSTFQEKNAEEFAIPSAAMLDDVKMKNFTSEKKAPNQETVAESGRSSLSRYVIDEKLEEEIKSTQEITGPFLQKIRSYKNISLDQMSEVTKISRSYLTAIETNNFSSLPAQVFTRGFVIQISKILGLDPRKVATSYMKLVREFQKK
jgi:curved DNA-binding protein CbpA